MKKKILATGLAVVMAISLFAGCGNKKDAETTKAETKEEVTTAAEDTTAENTAEKEDSGITVPSNLVTDGKLTYAVAATFPPYEYTTADGSYTGFDIELGEALAEKMGLEVEIMEMNFDGLISALQGGRCDIINSAMYIKPEREEQVDFIRYMYIGDTILVRSGTGDELGISGPEDLSGKLCAVTAGAVEEMTCNELNEQFKAEGKDFIELLALPTGNDAVLALKNGQADCMLYSSPSAAYLAEQQPGVFDSISSFNMNTEIGIAVRKGDTEMSETVSAALMELVEDGTYAALMEKYNLPADFSYFK